MCFAIMKQSGKNNCQRYKTFVLQTFLKNIFKHLLPKNDKEKYPLHLLSIHTQIKTIKKNTFAVC